MSKIAHGARSLADEGDPEVAWIEPMTDEQVEFMLATDIDSGDGRSEWLWIRLTNGDLLCGFFPQGESYFAHEAERDV